MLLRAQRLLGGKKMRIWIAFLLTAAFVLGAPQKTLSQDTTDDLVTVALQAAIDSLNRNPNQFSLSFTCIGANVSSSGGTGVSVTVQGGEAGSTTTGMIASADCSVGVAQTDAALRQEAEKAAKLLGEIKTLLQNQTAANRAVTQQSVLSRLADFALTKIAPAVISVLDALVRKRLGL